MDSIRVEQHQESLPLGLKEADYWYHVHVNEMNDYPLSILCKDYAGWRIDNLNQDIWYHVKSDDRKDEQSTRFSDTKVLLLNEVIISKLLLIINFAT